ncbi:hypothetical protein [Spiroplasma endosymbiont of Lonchoptera lutea]|uniref:hypothetical protein n=1 Tax=Spiroplasma endosymbiont of Lonchoptera lutea TaxID=3066297 RepID=UPI0030D3F739
MRKFLSALNLVCVMFISGCSKNSNDLKKYDLEFVEILNSSFTPSTYNLKDGWLDVAFVKNQLPNDLGPVGNYIYWSIIKTVRDFYEKNFTSIEHNEYYIDKIINVKITFTKNKDLTFSEYLITSFSAEMPY